MASCPCHNQLQPHEAMPGVCPPSPESLLFGTHPQAAVCLVQPFDPDQCYVWGGTCTACATGNEDDPTVQHEPTTDPWRDLGGEG